MTTAFLELLGIQESMLNARQLPQHTEASILVMAERGEDGREFMLTPAASDAWQRMKVQAQQDGINLLMVSAFRSVQRQTEIIQQKLIAGDSLAAILNVCAPPGYSEHHTGLAIDITCLDAPELEIDFEKSAAFFWLQQQAANFGFYMSYPKENAAGFQYEPWHWCFRVGDTIST